MILSLPLLIYHLRHLKFEVLIKNLLIPATLFFIILIGIIGGQSSKTTKNTTTKTTDKFPCQSDFAHKFTSIHFASDNLRNFPFVSDSGNGIVESIDLTNGNKNWSFDTGGTIVKRNLVNNEFTYIANTEENSDGANSFNLRSISNYSGIAVWKKKIEFADNFADQTVSEKTFLYDLKNSLSNSLLIRSDFCFARVNKSDGSMVWKNCIKSGNDVSNQTDPNDRNSTVFEDIYGFSVQNQIYLIDLINGEVLSKILVESEPTAIALADKSTIVYGDKKGKIRSLKIVKSVKKNIEKNKYSWTFKAGGEISGIVKTEKGLLISSFDNFIYMIDAESGGILWKKRFAEKLREKPAVDDNKAIINGDEKNSFIINLSDGKTIRQISLPNDEYYLRSSTFIDKDSFLLLTDKRILVFRNTVCSQIGSNIKSGK